MLNYYSYYSVGGYKDMYLGNSEMTGSDTYFLPLLPVWKKKAENNSDTALLEKVNILSKLPLIQILTEKESYNLPEDANIVFSHGGYKILFKNCCTGESILSIRDVEGLSRDEAGRPIPFLLAITGKNEEDKMILNKLCAYMASNLKTTGLKLSALFEYDAEKNGLCFHLEEFNNWINQVVGLSSGIINTVRKDYIIDICATGVNILIIPDGITRDLAIKEQFLQEQKVLSLSLEEIIPHDDSKRLIDIVKKMTVQQNTGIMKQGKVFGYIGGAAIVGFIIGYLSGYLSKQ